MIDIDKLPHDGLKIGRDFEFSSPELIEEDVVLLRPVHADVNVAKIGEEEVWIKGRVTTRLNFTCSRCLRPFEFPVDSRFDVVFLPEEFHELQDELDEEDVDQLFYRDRQIDLREVVLEQLNLTFPVQAPLLRELRGDLRGVRPDPARRRLRLRGPGDRRAPRRAQIHCERQEIMPNPKRRHSHSRKGRRRGARRPGRSVLLRLLELRDAQAPPPGLPRVRPYRSRQVIKATES